MYCIDISRASECSYHGIYENMCLRSGTIRYHIRVTTRDVPAELKTPDQIHDYFLAAVNLSIFCEDWMTSAVPRGIIIHFTLPYSNQHEYGIIYSISFDVSSAQKIVQGARTALRGPRQRYIIKVEIGGRIFMMPPIFIFTVHLKENSLLPIEGTFNLLIE